MPLQPLPEQAIVAAKLRKMAEDLIMQARALEATLPYRPTRQARLTDPKQAGTTNRRNGVPTSRDKLLPYPDASHG